MRQAEADCNTIYNALTEYLLGHGFTKIDCAGKMPLQEQTLDVWSESYEVTKYPHFDIKRKFVFCIMYNTVPIVGVPSKTIYGIHIKGIENTLFISVLYNYFTQLPFSQIDHNLHCYINGKSMARLNIDDPGMFPQLDKLLGLD